MRCDCDKKASKRPPGHWPEMKPRGSRTLRLRQSAVCCDGHCPARAWRMVRPGSQDVGTALHTGPELELVAFTSLAPSPFRKCEHFRIGAPLVACAPVHDPALETRGVRGAGGCFWEEICSKSVRMSGLSRKRGICLVCYPSPPPKKKKTSFCHCFRGEISRGVVER